MFIFEKYQVLLISLIVILLNGCSSNNMKDFENKTQSLIFEFFKGETVAYEFLKIGLENLEDSSELKLKEVLKKTSLHLMKNLFTTTGKKQQNLEKKKIK